jgi:hypothetical protein
MDESQKTTKSLSKLNKIFIFIFAIGFWILMVQVITTCGYVGLSDEILELYKSDPIAPYGTYHSLTLEWLSKNIDFIYLFVDEKTKIFIKIIYGLVLI